MPKNSPLSTASLLTLSKSGGVKHVKQAQKLSS